MNAFAADAVSTPTDRAPLNPWLCVLAGFAAMYLPVYWSASQDLWQTDELGHGPIVLGVAGWFFWKARSQIATAPLQRAAWLGWALFAIGLLQYGTGRLFAISSVTFFSQIFVAAGALVLVGGRGALRAGWFPLVYLLFMVPLPASLVDAITGPLKNLISVVVVDVLYGIGYPISRAGVTISIGPYQLLVADACTGLNSMFSLAATGVLFMYLMKRASVLHNAIVLAAILPIAFLANIVRVVALVLITHYLGDEAGQGFLHSAAGLTMFMVAIALFIGLDWCMSALAPASKAARQPVGQQRP